MVTANDCEISGAYLRGFLAGLRKVTGSQYLILLSKAGLSEYSQKYPVPDANIVATGKQVINLFTQVHILLGTDTYNFFMKNLAREFARVSATLPHAQLLTRGINPQIPDEQFKHWLVQLVEIARQSINQEIVIDPGDNPREFRLRHLNCIYCAGQENLDKPGCLFVTTFYKQVILELSGIRCDVQETRCGATHNDPDCYFLLRRL